jgi:transposase
VLPELLGVPEEAVNDSRLYRTLDVVLPLKSMIQGHLKQRAGELFTTSLDLLLYDVTSTYFEGLAEENDLAARGHSRDGRPDCKQVCLGLVVTREGFPIGYEVFAGNRPDVTTLEEIVEMMEARYGAIGRIWVLDRGIASEANLAFLRGRGARYLVGTPRTMLKRFEARLLDEDWEEVRGGIEVKLLPSPDGAETFVLCRSADRMEKERAIHTRFVTRIETALVRLAGTLQRARKRRERGAIERQLGRLLAKNSRAAGAFHIEVREAPEVPSGLRLVWTREAAWEDWAAASEGCYLLRTNVTDLSAQELWRTYIQLTEAEAAFRTAKSDLRVRPIWHQVDRRVEAHILFSFLALALWRTLQAWMEHVGLGRGARTLIEDLARIKAVEVLLPTTAGRTVRLCCISRPDPGQQALLDRLCIQLPERLGRPKWFLPRQELDRPCSLDF